MILNDLIQIKEKQQAARKKIVLRCCMAAGCMSSDSKGVKERLEKAVADAGLLQEVEVRGVGCMKLCCEGPLVAADPQGALYVRVTAENAPSIVAALDGGKASAGQTDPQAPFFAQQFSIVLANSGVVDPERIESYIAADGYQALHEVLHEMTPKEVVETMVKCGLRGRGGAGFPTGLKWGTVAKSSGTRKYVICNADEGDPGAFMDRSVLESDPHSVLEGMAIAAYAVGADQGFIYVRAEYPLAISRLQVAIKQAKQMGLLGRGIFESPFNFNVDLRIGAGAFVCGEETALMASVEGKRGTPRPRPPFPAESGLFGCPTLLNNVETFANVPTIYARARMVRRHWHRKEQGHEGVCAGGQDQEHRPARGADGHAAAQDRRGNGRRRPGRWRDQGGADRRTVRRAAFRRSISIPRWIMNRSAGSARSWAPAV
jgi:bidirectional [NiFe] hydrogenase diaphorase subunit